MAYHRTRVTFQDREGKFPVLHLLYAQYSRITEGRFISLRTKPGSDRLVIRDRRNESKEVLEVRNVSATIRQWQVWCAYMFSGCAEKADDIFKKLPCTNNSDGSFTICNLRLSTEQWFDAFQYIFENPAS